MVERLANLIHKIIRRFEFYDNPFGSYCNFQRIQNKISPTGGGELVEKYLRIRYKQTKVSVPSF